MPIRRLPTLLVNQIAAGEVVERPASVVKELVENAIDAGATRIGVDIEGGGTTSIRITDDGGGIEPEELELAVAPHATSKIVSVDDLDAIATLGFRGEALASISAVSRFSIVSRPQGRDAAMKIEVEGDQVGTPAPAAGPYGTTITVRNLFFNTPARRRFLKTDQTESSRVTEAVRHLALPHPSIGFTLRSGERTTIDLPPGQTPAERVVGVLGRELAEGLIEIDTRVGDVGMWGMIGRPELARGTAQHVRVFLNGRSITDRAITHALREAYRGLIEPGRHPTVALFLDIDPALVDVNVHPTKAEVRFRHGSSVHEAVRRSVKAALKEHDLVPAFDVSRARAPQPVFGAATRQGRPPSAIDTSPAPQSTFVMDELREAMAEPKPAPTLPTFRHTENVLQVHSTFLVTQDEAGLVIIDQHALHERVMFEKLKERVEAGTMEMQRLLVPAVIDVEPSQMERLETLQPLLERLGIEASPMGPTTIGVHAFTSLLFERKVDPVEFMTDLLDRAGGDGLGADHEAALHEVLDMMSCKAAIKAGDRLAPEEIDELLRLRETIERSTNCPHGRPTTLRLSIEDLERQFGRR